MDSTDSSPLIDCTVFNEMISSATALPDPDAFWMGSSTDPLVANLISETMSAHNGYNSLLPH